MKTDEADHDNKEEADHVHDDERQKEVTKDSATAETGEPVIDNQGIETLGQEIEDYWAAPEVLRLVNDKVFMEQCANTCRYHFYRCQPPPDYTEGDFKADVLAHFVKGLSQYRGEATLNTLLYKIAFNWRVSISRQPHRRFVSFEELNLEGEDGEKRYGTDFEGGALEDRYSETNRNDVASTEDNIVLVKELMSGLTDKERSLCEEYFFNGCSATEISKQLGVSRQAVAKQLTRVVAKLRASLEQPAAMHRVHVANKS